MPPKTKTTRQSTLKLDQLETRPSKKQKLKPLSKPPPFDLSQSQSQSQGSNSESQSLRVNGPKGFRLDDVVEERATLSNGKGKGKARALNLDVDDRLWVDKFAPGTEEELAVHKRKVEDVRRWLNEAFSGEKIAKYRRLLVLTGPAGCGKTATLRVLAREMDFSIMEWGSAPATGGSTPFNPFSDEGSGAGFMFENDWESAMDKFETFLGRVGSYRSVFDATNTVVKSRKPSSQSRSQSQPQLKKPPSKTIILLEDLPNILHPGTRARFHDALKARVMASAQVPIVVVISDAGVRGEDEEPGVRSTGGWAKRQEAVDVRTVLPPGLGAAYSTEIAFNPVAPTFMTAALKSVLERVGMKVSAAVLSNVVDGAAGDVRSAVMGLEFACARAGVGGSKKRGRDGAGSMALEAMTRKENALFLFHLLGKVLYNKRKGDPPSQSTTAREAAVLRELDKRLKDQPALPPWLEHEARKTSRVDADELYASTPIDASLFGLYIHQNYTQFCTDIEQCDRLVDGLSWVDANGGENVGLSFLFFWIWYETNPYTFHLHALETLHALPAPVERSGQKMFKPEFFAVGRREREAGEGVEGVRAWLSEESMTLWPRNAVTLEMGAVLKAYDRQTATANKRRPPREHRLFSEIMFVKGAGGTRELADERDAAMDVDVGKEVEASENGGWRRGEMERDGVEGRTLEDDDIEEW
ncbi:Rad17 cell cycle checkpoint protein-domain-containing protein [Amylostereum chailletii]|nr:Rad17 cell cycle checkpoint protein-domain-containing protein [Amylostereum chailletii]